MEGWGGKVGYCLGRGFDRNGYTVVVVVVGVLVVDDVVDDRYVVVDQSGLGRAGQPQP